MTHWKLFNIATALAIIAGLISLLPLLLLLEVITENTARAIPVYSVAFISMSMLCFSIAYVWQRNEHRRQEEEMLAFLEEANAKHD